MQKVEIYIGHITAVQVFESCDAVILVDLNEVRFPVLLNAFGFADGAKSICEFSIIREHIDCSSVPLDAGLVTHTILAECFLRQIHHLGGCTSALNWHGWQCKQSITAFELFSHDRCLVCTLKIINGGCWSLVAIKSFFRSFNHVPSELGASSNN